MKSGLYIGNRFFIYVPAEVARDGTFPFKPLEAVIVRIDKEERGR